MVTDSLRYWAQEVQIDGFRFDLATILGREPHGFEEDGRFLDTCRQDPALSRVKLIAEPWDCGPGGYQVGRFSPGWAEWNDRYRDTVRAYWKGEEGKLPELAPPAHASADIFNKRGRKPWASVNFITAHDGFTLNDLVSYNEKHNEANGEDNKDGHDHNLSFNHGIEGPTDDPEISAAALAPDAQHARHPALLARNADAARRRRVRAARRRATTTPIARTTRSPGSTGRGSTRTASSCSISPAGSSQLRQTLPILRRGRFLTGAYNEELDVKDVTWLTPAGEEMTPEHWQDPPCPMHQHPARRPRPADRHPQARHGRHPAADRQRPSRRGEVQLPEVIGGRDWMCLIDTEPAGLGCADSEFEIRQGIYRDRPFPAAVSVEAGDGSGDR